MPPVRASNSVRSWAPYFSPSASRAISPDLTDIAVPFPMARHTRYVVRRRRCIPSMWRAVKHGCRRMGQEGSVSPLQIRPVGGAAGCLVMLLVSVVLSVLLTVGLNLLLR